MATPKDETTRGFLEALCAFSIWGVLPVYWHFLANVEALEILLHRIIWSALALAIYFLFRGQLTSSLLPLIRNRRILKLLLLNAVLISANWLTYIWAINNGHVLETSLGYFINPILSVLLGSLILKERLGKVQWFAVALVSAAIVVNILRSGYFPKVALLLAGTFAVYGLIKKVAKVGSLESLWFETAVAAIPSVFILAYQTYYSGAAFLRADAATHTLLIGAGLVTAAPLVLFGWAAQRLKLATIGFMQFIAPTMQFALAIWYFKEDLNTEKLITFIFVWSAVLLYMLGSRLRARNA